MNNQTSINVEGLPPVIIRGLDVMISTLRDGLQQKTIQPEKTEEKYPWTVIEGVKIGVIKREDCCDERS